LLIVSHDKGAIQSICDRAILLNAGRLAMEGEPEAVMDYYNAMLADHQNQQVKQEVREDGKVQTISGTGEAVLEIVQLLNGESQPVEVVNIGENLRLKTRFKAFNNVPSLTVGFMVKDRLGQPVFGTNTHHLKHEFPPILAGQSMDCTFTFNANFGVGSYSVSVALHSGDTHVFKSYEWRDLAAVFNVVNLDKPESVGTAWVPVVVAEQLV